MRAMILDRPAPAEQNPLRQGELPLPVPGPGEVRVQVRVCGVCRTDFHIAEGELPLPKLPIVPGHQIVGVVDAVGTGVSAFRPGDRVGVPWVYSTCGECVYCRNGAENLCERGQFTGYHAHGGYAEAMIARESFVYPIPADFADLAAAPLLCAGIVGYRSLKLSQVGPGERLGMYGFGASAHVVMQVARHWGCEVFVFTRAETHRQMARELGAAWVGGAEDTPPELLDAAIIFAPAGHLVLDALRVLRKGGTVAIADITMSPIPEINYDRLLYHERVVRSVANSTRQDAHEFLRLAAEIPVRTEVQEFPLADANQALQAMKHSRIRGAAVLRIS